MLAPASALPAGVWLQENTNASVDPQLYGMRTVGVKPSALLNPFSQCQCMSPLAVA